MGLRLLLSIIDGKPADQTDAFLTSYVQPDAKNAKDGKGNAFKPFTSASGQIMIDPDVWRRAERNRTGDRFTFDVRRSVLSEVSLQGTGEQRFVVRLAESLKNGVHTLELIPTTKGDTKIEALEVFHLPVTHD